MGAGGEGGKWVCVCVRAFVCRCVIVCGVCKRFSLWFQPLTKPLRTCGLYIIRILYLQQDLCILYIHDRYVLYIRICISSAYVYVYVYMNIHPHTQNL